jgi:hypothetical protein
MTFCIKTGDPSNEPASFTRFILPFAYKPEQLSASVSTQDQKFKINTNVDDKIWRQKYLTFETADVLFNRTKWFKLNCEYGFETDITLDINERKETNKIRINTPELILFEWNENTDKDFDILKVGLLVLEVYLPIENNITNIEKLSQLPEEIKIIHSEHCNNNKKHFLTDNLYYDSKEKCLVNKGNIFKKDKDELLKKSEDADYKNAIQNLYNKIHYRVSLNYFLMMNELLKYWQIPYEKHLKQFNYEETIYNKLKTNTKQENNEQQSNDTAKENSTNTNNKKDLNEKNRFYCEIWEQILEKPIEIEGKSYRLFPQKWNENALKFEHTEKLNLEENWAIYSDNRSFVWTCVITEKGGDDLKFLDDKMTKAWEFGQWVKLLNVDRPEKNDIETLNVRNFEKEWAEKCTYKRFEEWGTYYGYTYHSGAMFGPDFEEPPIWKHFGQMYFDQAMLLLYLRTVIFRFSQQINIISSKALDNSNKNKKTNDKMSDFKNLLWSFTIFTNMYEFPFFSNQQQGLEMYALNRKKMEIDEFFEEVKEEINDTYNYLNMYENIEQTQNSVRLSVVASIGLILALIYSFLGMNIFDYGIKDNNAFFNTCFKDGKLALSFFASIILSFINFFIILLVFKKSDIIIEFLKPSKKRN